MRYDLVDLKLFVAVADAGNISRGAAACHLAPSSASLRIKQLEDTLGTRLFSRHAHGVELTRAGHVMIEHCRRSLAELEQMHADLAPYARGVKSQVTLFANSTAIASYLPDDLAAYFARFPGVRVALEEVSAGAQWVKVLGDFPGPDGNWFTAPANYPRDVLTTLVREAHAAGARVMAHSTGLGAADLVHAGVDAIEHGMALTPDLVAAMADRSIAWTTTFATAYKHVGPLAAQQSPVGAYLRGQFDRLRDLLPRAAALGVPILAGTDEVPGAALVRELEYLPPFGLTTTQALAAGSTAARAWLGFPTVEVGGVADLVLYDTDPRVDPAALDRPSAVVFDGARVV